MNMVLGEDLSIMADGESLVFMCFFTLVYLL